MSRTAAEWTRGWYQANARQYDRHNPGLPGDRAFYASLCHGGHVLEIGAGTGRITEAIAGVARTVIAVDNAPAMLAIARQRLRHNPAIALVLADAGNLPFSTEFDRIILAYRTVQHFDPAVRRQLWRNARTLLAPDGMVSFDTWHGPRSTGHKDHHVTISHISVEELEAELIAFGLRVLSLQTSFSGYEDNQSLTRVWLVAP